MQVVFRTKQLKRCYEKHAAAARRWGGRVARRYVERINILSACESTDDLYKVPSFKFHPLKGDRKGQYALVLVGRVRLIVSFAGELPTVVYVEEVSKHYGD